MRRLNTYLLLACLPIGVAFAQNPTASKELDPATGDYIITYTGDDGRTYTTRFEPGNKIVPAISSSFTGLGRGPVQLVYEYRIRNSSLSQRDIFAFSVPVSDLAVEPRLIKSCSQVSENEEDDPTSSAKNFIAKPQFWRPSVADRPPFCLGDGTQEISYSVSWTYFTGADDRKLTPGQGQGGFCPTKSGPTGNRAC